MEGSNDRKANWRKNDKRDSYGYFWPHVLQNDQNWRYIFMFSINFFEEKRDIFMFYQFLSQKKPDAGSPLTFTWVNTANQYIVCRNFVLDRKMNTQVYHQDIPTHFFRYICSRNKFIIKRFHPNNKVFTSTQGRQTIILLSGRVGQTIITLTVTFCGQTITIISYILTGSNKQ